MSTDYYIEKETQEMTITSTQIDLKALHSNLVFAKAAVGKTYDPILRLMRVEIAEDVAMFSFFGYEVSVKFMLPASGDDASFAIDIDILTDAVKTVGSKNMAAFELDDETLTIKVDGMTSTARLASAKAREEMPAHPVVLTVPTITTTGPELARVALIAGAAIGADDTLPMLTGVQLRVEGGELEATTTNRFALAVAESTTDSSAGNIDALLPGRPFLLFAKRAAKASTATVTLEGETIAFATVDCELITQQLDANFPEWRGLFPSESKTSFTFDGASLLRAVKGLPKNSNIKLHIGKDRVEVTGHKDGEQLMSMSLDVAELECEDDATVIMFNAAYVAKILAAVPKGMKIQCSATTPSHPVVYSWAGARTLLMPVRIPS